jgi:protein arginine N-methyltransferase 1
MYSYSLAGYGEMLADRVRMEAYAGALRRTIKPGSVVLDIGTGPGIWSVLACELGASRVIAVEPDSIIQVAREVAVSNQCSDKIEFIEKALTSLELPIQADVIVSDMRGVLPLFGQNIPSVVDARRRFLAPRGALIGRRDIMSVALVEALQSYNRLADPWEHNVLKQDLSPARRRAVNAPHKARARPEQLLAKPKLWVALDYMTIEDPNVQGELEWAVERSGTGHGFLVWFDADLTDGVGFSNAPGAPETIYGSLFFPWQTPVSLAAGQRVCVNLEAKLVESDYVWRWTTEIEPPTGSGGAQIRFDQSSLQGEVLSVQALQKRASIYVPQLSEELRIRRRALEMIDGRASLEDIARRLTAEFPSRFTQWHQALSYAGTVSKELGD